MEIRNLQQKLADQLIKQPNKQLILQAICHD